MAGGKKNQKKRRRKSWTAVLKGCFNKSPFAPAARSGKQRCHSQQHCDQRQAHKPRRFPENMQALLKLYPSSQPPIRGILKKSPTLSTCSSSVYNEAAVDVPDKLLKSPNELSHTRPAFFIQKSVNTPDVMTNNRVGRPNSRDGGPSSNFGERSIRDREPSGRNLNFRQQQINGNAPYCDGITYRRRHKSFNDLDSTVDMREGWHPEIRTQYNAFHPCYDTYNESYEALRNRLQQRLLGHQLHSIAPARRVGTSPSSRQCAKETAGSTPISLPCEVDKAEINFRPTTPDLRRNLMNLHRSVSPDVYVQLQEIQQRKQHQRNTHPRPASVSPVSRNKGCPARFPQIANSPYHALSIKEMPDSPMPSQKSSTRNDGHESESSSRSGQYVTSPLPRSRDPIKKTLKSPHYACPNSLNKTSDLREMDRCIQTDDVLSECSSCCFSNIADGDSGSPSQFLSANQEIASVSFDNDVCHTRANEPDHGLEVSHIYATVARSNTRSEASSYIYASISWEASNDSGSSQIDTSDMSVPLIPPRLWTKSGQVSHYTRELSEAASRPPLPSYEEILESRIKGRRRQIPAWSEVLPQVQVVGQLCAGLRGTET